MGQTMGIVFFLALSYSFGVILSLNTYRPKYFSLLKKEVELSINKPFIGKKTLDLTPEQLLLNAENSQILYSWDKIEKVIITSNYFFIYDSAISAMIIPKNELSDDLILHLEYFIKDFVKVEFRNQKI